MSLPAADLLAAAHRFDVRLPIPDLRRWREGNTGIAGFTSRQGPEPGPHVALLALTHGNEFAGAIALDRLLREGIRPARGRLTFGFVDLAAFERFDPRHPTLSRFVDEDLNRIWSAASLDGPARSSELTRAREIRPLIDTVDVLLDLHSMLWPSDPLNLCGNTEKGLALALGIGIPELVVADRGHAGGPRLIDYERFSDPTTPFIANLVECGQHWEPATVEVALAAVRGLLRHLRLVADVAPAPSRAPAQRIAKVTHAVTAQTNAFSFTRQWRGGEVIAARDTLIGRDDEAEIRTPYDDCLLVMPSLRPSRGHTAVRLARFV